MFGEILAILAALNWGFSSIIDKKAVDKINPLLANTLRAIPACLFSLLVMVVFEGIEFLFLMTLYEIFLTVIGTVFALIIGDLLFLYSLKKLGVAKSIPITSTYPFFAIISASVFLSEEVSIFLLFGTIMIILGIWFVIKSEKIEENHNKTSKIYLILPIFTALSWGLSQIFFKIVLYTTPPLTMNSVKMLSFSIMLITLILIKGERKFYLTYKKKAGKMAALGGLIAIGIGGVLLMSSLNLIDVSKTASLTAITPLFSTLLALIFLKEKITLKLLIGTILTIVGVLLITLF
ncbi:MAG: DMT family transporter [Candidatus Odinarchaeia archaeon]